MLSKEMGILGEEIASKYLKGKGYRILERNYSPRFVPGPLRGEIDIVASQRDIIVFIEVKTIRKSQNNFFNPEDKVDFTKQRKIIKTAESWLIENKISLETKWQIDILVVEIDLDKRKAKIKHLENAAA